jgi:UDP-3-O-[3-hydroxymyristoyl] N-acetylglucosamine deacetylase
VEHILSALRGMGVHNALIEVDGPEVPILDGSALPWVQALETSITPAEEEIVSSILPEAFSFQYSKAWYCAIPSKNFTLICVTQFDHPLLGAQTAIFQPSKSNYAQNIAPARTFGFIEEIEELRKRGLALGGALDNALVVYPDHFSDKERIPEECCRHKLLDMIGDFSLLKELPGVTITAIKPGHAGNITFARILEQHIVSANRT